MPIFPDSGAQNGPHRQVLKEYLLKVVIIAIINIVSIVISPTIHLEVVDLLLHINIVMFHLEVVDPQRGRAAWASSPLCASTPGSPDLHYDCLDNHDNYDYHDDHLFMCINPW